VSVPYIKMLRKGRLLSTKGEGNGEWKRVG
jgi:hypothetical protein